MYVHFGMLLLAVAVAVAVAGWGANGDDSFTGACNVVGFGAGSERAGVRRSVGLVVDAWCLAGDKGHGQ